MPKRALLLVKETSGIAAFAERLVNRFGFELLANEAAGKALAAKNLPYELIEEQAGAGLISDKEAGVALLVANYVDVETAGRAFMSWKSALAAFDRAIVESIRAAAWATERTAVLGNPADYVAALLELERNGSRFSQSFRMERSIAALRAASEFDFAVARYLEIQGADAPDMSSLSGYPKAIRFVWPRARTLESGENRHQQAALYGSFFDHFEQVAGPKLDYAAVHTVSRAAHLIGEFEKPCAALFRKGRLVSVRCGRDLGEAVEGLLERGDASGAWLALNGSVGAKLFERALDAQVAGILIPDLSVAERERLAAAGSICGLISNLGMGYEALQEVRSVVGGALVQDKDRGGINPMEWVTQGLVQPLVEDWEPMLLGAKVVRHLDSSACVVLRGEELVVLESGRHSQSECWRSISERNVDLSGSVAVFDEALESPPLVGELKASGIRTLLAPSGPLDAELKEAANEVGLAFLTMNRSLRRL